MPSMIFGALFSVPSDLVPLRLAVKLTVLPSSAFLEPKIFVKAGSFGLRVRQD